MRFELTNNNSEDHTWSGTISISERDLVPP